MKNAPTRYAYWVVLLFMMGIFAWCYVSLASIHALNADEGLYATGAMHFAEGDLLLQKADTDKPPLTYHLQGIALLVFGRNEMAVKAPNLAFLLVLFLVVFVMGKKISGPVAGLIAVLLLATSPYLGKCGIGAMTDPPAVAFLTAALLMAIDNRIFWSGFFFGMALLTRQMALLYFPVLLVALAWRWKGEGRGKWAVLKSFIWGAAGPLAWLVVWSGFFEREPFQWLVQELFSGKVTLGAARAGIGERTWFWLKELATFPNSGIVWAAALLSGALLVFRKGTRPAGDGDEGETKWVIHLFLGALVYYPLIHILMGAPLYRRMLFPLLPLTALLIAWLVVEAAKKFIGPVNRGNRAGLWVLFFMLFTLGMIRTFLELAQVHPRDDNPELAEKINQWTAGPTVVFSTDMNRELMFYLHGNKAKRKQFKQDPAFLKSLVPHYAGARLLIALRKAEEPLLQSIEAILKPQYRLTQVYETARGLARLYEILPNVRRVEEGNEIIYEYYKNGTLTRTRVSVETAREGLERFASRILECQESEIHLQADDRLPDGFLKRISISAPGVKVRQVAVDRLSLEYEDVTFDWPQLLAVDQLVIRDKGTAAAKLTLSGEGLSAFLQKKNKNIENMTATVTEEGIQISGEVPAAGKSFSFQVEGALSLDKEGGVWFAPKRGTLNSRRLPGFVLAAIGKAVNPTFAASIEALNLVADELRMGEGEMELVLH